MGYRERQRRAHDVEPDPGSGSPMSLAGQLLWLGLRAEGQKWYGLLFLLPRLYLTIRFSRRMRQLCDRMAAAQRLGGAEAEAAQREFTSEFMALLVEKRLVKPAAKPE